MDVMKKITSNVSIFVFLFIIVSCNMEQTKVLDLAGDNRVELEKVISHFVDDPDPLKYRAAKFLIDNMSGLYYNVGPAVDANDSLYLATAGEPQNLRTKIFNSNVSHFNKMHSEIVYDLKTIKSDYLINVIEEACAMWNKSPWHEEYDDSLFFEYVLPYRIYHESIKDWKFIIKDEYPMLTEDYVVSRRGFQMEAEQALGVDCEIKNFKGAACRQAQMMFKGKSSVSFTVNSERQTHKRLIVKYSTIARQMKAVVNVNGEFFDTLRLVPTRNLESFVEKWFNKALPIKKGKNTIDVLSVTDTLCLDYIQFGAVENFSNEDIVDFSDSYYSLVNKKTQKCISYNTRKITKENIIELKPLNRNDSTQMLSLDYAGYSLWRVGFFRRDSMEMVLNMDFGTPCTLSAGSIVTVDRYAKKPFQQWIFFPVGDESYRIMNKHTGMFLDSRIDSLGRELLIQNTFSGNESQIWTLLKHGKKLYDDTFFRVNSAFSEAMKVFDLTHQFEYYIYNSNYFTNPCLLFKTKSGKCADETCFSVYLSRYLGIPAAYDFTPHWGNRSGSHSWCVLIGNNGKSVPFFSGNVPGDTIHYFYSYVKPKVFRYRYSVNKRIENDLKSEKYVPKLFVKPHFVDVTDEYCTTSDIARPVPKEYNNSRVAYLCVFDNRNWVPVDYGMIRGNKVKFKSIGRGVMYMAGLYIDGMIVPFGNPFYITKSGEVKEVCLDENKTISLTLLRKYPFMGAQDYFNSRMDGGRFEASKKSDFSDSTVLYVHKGITNGNWYNIPINDRHTFRFLRYMGGKGSFCNINELEFFDVDGNKLEGTIVGTEGEDWAKKETVFDGNVLTGFCALSPDENWVGLALNKSSVVSKIRYIGRNDGNGIEVNDNYELLYWRPNDGWISFDTKVATENVLCFENVPTGGLYVLKDLTKGIEERIFTYENGKQVWW